MRVKYKANFKGLEKLSDALSDKLETKLGVLSDNNTRTEEGDEATNADLGLVHEFGSFKKNIPPRSWLRMPIERKAEDISNFILKSKKEITEAMVEGDSELFYEKLGIAGEAVVQEAFGSAGFGQWKANSASTIKSKGSSSPLIDTGELRGSVMSKVVKRNGS